MGNSHILNSISIGSTISPKDLCCNTIVRYVRAMRNQTGAALAVHSIADGQMEAVEFLVDKNTRYIKEPLKKLTLKKNVLVACIIHELKQEIPNGDSFYQIGDTVIVVTSVNKVIYQLNDIFAE